MHEGGGFQMTQVLEAMDAAGLKGPVLLDVPSTQFVKTSLLLIKGLSQDRGLPGLFVSVDRPHQYMVHLLSVQRVKTENLRFLDVISRFAADTKTASAKVGVADGPFHIDRLVSSFPALANNGSSEQNAGSKYRYVIIDNLASLLAFNNLSSVSVFIEALVHHSEENGGLLIPIILDSQKSAALYDAARAKCHEELRIRAVCEAAPAGSAPNTLGETKET